MVYSVTALSERQAADLLLRHHRDEEPRGGSSPARSSGRGLPKPSSTRSRTRSSSRTTICASSSSTRRSRRCSARSRRTCSAVSAATSCRPNRSRSSRSPSGSVLETGRTLRGRGGFRVRRHRPLAHRAQEPRQPGQRQELRRLLRLRRDRNEAPRDGSGGGAQASRQRAGIAAGARHHLRRDDNFVFANKVLREIAAASCSRCGSRAARSGRRSPSAIRSAISARAAIRRSMRSTTPTPTPGSTAILARYHLSAVDLRAAQSRRPLVQGLRQAHRRRHLHRRARRDHRA